MDRKCFVIGFLGLLLFVIEAFSVSFEASWVKAFDGFFIEHIRTQIQSNLSLNEWIKSLSHIGSSKTIIALSILITIGMFWKKRFALGVWFIASVGVAMVVLKILKTLIARERPNPEFWLSTASGFSYPSGHSLSVSVFCFLVFLLLCLSKIKTPLKALIGILLMFLIVLIMYSRIYLGVHYPSDVLGGFLLGLTLAFFSVGIYLRFLHPQNTSL